MSQVIEHMDELEQDRFEARYFNAMSEAEARIFDEELKRDDELARRYRTFQLVVKGITSTPAKRTDHRQELRERFRQIDLELDRSAAAHFRPYWLAAAAVLLVLLGVWSILRPPLHVRLAEEFSVEEPGLPVLMTTNPGSMDAIMNDLKLGRYVDAGKAIDSRLKDRPTNDTLHYYAGIVSAKLGRCDAGITHFEQVRNGSAFATKALYHRAVCELHEGRIATAKELLGSVMESREDQLSARARELRERL